MGESLIPTPITPADASTTTAKLADGAVTVAKLAAGLINPDDTLAAPDDVTVPSTGAVAGYAVPLSSVGAASGVAPLDAGSKVPVGNLPAFTLNDVDTVASEAAMLALPVSPALRAAIRSDTGLTFVLPANADPTVLGNWVQLPVVGGGVASVNGATGVVTGVTLDANNLSDLANAVTARANLGLGSASTHPAGDFDASGAAATAQAAAAADATTKANAAAAASVPIARSLPAGGTTHQGLRKIDGADYNTEWADLPSGGVPADGSITTAKLADGAVTVAKLGTTLDAIPAPVANLALNNKRMTGVAAGVAGTDAATVSQLPAGLPGSANGDIPVYQSGGTLGTNFALAMVADASSNAGESFVAANVNDGNLGSVWAGSDNPSQPGDWIRLHNTAGPIALNQAKITCNSGFRPPTFKLQGSTDGASWTDLATDAGGGAVVTFHFSGTYEWWRLFEVDTGSNYWEVAEFELYNVSGAWIRLPVIPNGHVYGAVAGMPADLGVPVLGGDTNWTNVVGGVGFQNSWADAGGAFAPTGFRKDGTGRVDFRVSMKSGATATVAFTFPTGYLPAATQTFTGQAEPLASDVPVELSVAADGTATVNFVGSLTGNVYVTGTFWNGQ